MTKSLAALLQNLDVLELRGNPETQVKGLTYDSRQVKQGDLFVAIRGARLDGNAFISDAVERGAQAVVTDNALSNGAPVTIVQVSDSRKALAKLAFNFFEQPSLGLQLIGVTGTNGKTTTTLLLESILKCGGNSPGVIGTLGYRWTDKKLKAALTTPGCLDLQRILYEMRQDGVSHVVMEVSSHGLALGRVDECFFRAGVFTNLSQDHLDFHKTIEEYFEAKAKLFENYLALGEGASAAIVNLDDEFGRRLASRAKGDLWGYSISHGKARVSVKSCELKPSGIHARLSTPLGDMEVNSPLLGRLNLYNVLAATTTALALGIPDEAIRLGLQSVCFVDGRLQRVTIPAEAGFQVIVDYAHTPDAMEKSLSCLKEMTKGRLLVVFGCGGDRDRGKRPLMGEVAAKLGDLLVLTSDNPRSEVPARIIQDIEPGVRAQGLVFLEPDKLQCPHRGFAVEVDRRKAIELALSWAREDDVVFIGGKGHETYQIVGDRVLSFDDRIVVREYFGSCAGDSRRWS